jgi:ABC-type spermidine/putrescine transport system permease subunit II
MEKRTTIYLTMAHFGFAATLGFLAAFALDWPDFVKGLMIGMLMIPLIVLPLRGMRDEYIDGLWKTGTAWAFVGVVIAFLFGPFLEGVYDGFTSNGSGQDIPASSVGFIAIMAFFTGFHLKWLRG